MRMNNSAVCRAWAAGRVASNHTGTLVTDGIRLYSYQLCIGVEDVTVIDYTAGGGDFRSQTTSCHVNLAKRFALDVVHPPSAQVVMANSHSCGG
jgi:hypothetical protein